jgi:ADP-L-glycero-D-manno-heptose 6-epimerase
MAQLAAKNQYHTCAKIERLRETGYRKEIAGLPLAVVDYVKGYLVPDLRLGDERQLAARETK